MVFMTKILKLDFESKKQLKKSLIKLAIFRTPINDLHNRGRTYLFSFVLMILANAAHPYSHTKRHFL